MEHQRTKDHMGNIYQWYDAERVMVLDVVTGKPERFAAVNNSIGTLEEALEYVNNYKGWESRFVIVRLQCIVAGKIVEGKENKS